MWLSMAVLLSAAATLAGQTEKLSAGDDQLFRIVLDPQADIRFRRDSVTTLVDRGDGVALRKLLDNLKNPADASARRAILWGIRNSKSPPTAAAQLLLQLAEELEGPVLEDAAEIMGRSLPEGQWPAVMKLARNEAAKPAARQLAIIALGHRRTQDGAGLLVSLLAATENDTERALAAGALARLTGIDDRGSDALAWGDWWKEVAGLSSEAWQAHLLGNITRRAERLVRQRDALQDRLMTAMRQRYRALDREEREPVLTAMLADPLDSVRELALDLVRELVNGEKVGAELTRALVTRLDDHSWAVRGGAALILRDLKSEAAADLVAKRLADDLERHASVLKAYLLLMRRQPRLAAMGPAVTLLNDPEVRGEAAGALLAGFDHWPPLIGREQADRIADQMRTTLARESSPEPRFIELLARAGNRDDFRTIRAWLDHSSDAVREAAARAWVASGQSLEPLAQRAGDPIVQIIVIPAATERGMSRQTMLALAAHRPENEQIAAAWGRALVAMSPRVSPDAVVQTDQKLAAYGDLTDLRLQVLSPAIDKLLGRVGTVGFNTFGAEERQIFTLQLADLLLARSEARLSSGDSKAALADLDRVTALKIDLSHQQQQRLTLTTIHALITGGEIDGAFAKAGKYLAVEQPDKEIEALRSQIIELLLTAADQCLTAQQHERASQIVTRLRARLPRPVDLKVEMRTAILEQRIKMALEAPTTPVPTPQFP